MRKNLTLFLALNFQIAVQCLGQDLPYKDPKLSIDKRVDDLISRMTMEEKFWQLFMIPEDLDNINTEQFYNGIFGLQVRGRGDSAENALTLAQKVNRVQKYFVEKTRLGIPVIVFEEALHGVVRPGATIFPQSIALASTWDTALMHEVSLAIAEETKARGIRDVLSPVINIASDVRWGRTEETYGEDPFLSSKMAVAFVKEFEKTGIITTPKHFIANVGDGGRDSYPIHFDERLLREIYFPPFRDAILEGGATSIMTAYNSVDGQSSSSNSWMLQKILKGEWGFKGFAISDANAIGGDVVLHHTAPNSSVAGGRAIDNGLDVIFQTNYDHYKPFIKAFLDGKIDEDRINDAVSRVLRAKMKLGLFENPYVSEQLAAKWVNNNSHKALARKAADESIVLLRNKNEVLPLKKDIKSVAIIGEDAVEGRLGGYSGPGNGKVNILEGIKKRAGTGIKVNYAEGCGRVSPEWVVIPTQYFSANFEGKIREGLHAEYFNNIHLEGKPEVDRMDPRIDFRWTLGSPDKKINNEFFSARWSGMLTSPQTGKFNIGLDGNDGFRMFINGELVIDNWSKVTYSTRLVDYDFEKDKKYAIRVEFYEPVGNSRIRLIWNAGVAHRWKEQIANAVEAARLSDVAIVVVGINEGEFQDRAMLALPGHQEEMIRAVAETAKPVVVVLIGGSAITLHNWIDKVDAIIDAWYPGEEGGNAVADVLFGDFNPAGRLPITFPLDESQLPLVYNHKPTGRGDDYINLSGLPQFPFGFGLSYAHFTYANISLERDEINPTDSVAVKFQVTNTGKVPGEEVVQLYIRDDLSSVSQPVMQLKGFQRIHFDTGEVKYLEFRITPDMLSLLNKEQQKVVEPGSFTIMIGSSSRDIRLKANLRIK